jgi:hypothetical protein
MKHQDEATIIDVTTSAFFVLVYATTAILYPVVILPPAFVAVAIWATVRLGEASGGQHSDAEQRTELAQASE